MCRVGKAGAAVSVVGDRHLQAVPGPAPPDADLIGVGPVPPYVGQRLLHHAERRRLHLVRDQGGVGERGIAVEDGLLSGSLAAVGQFGDRREIADRPMIDDGAASDRARSGRQAQSGRRAQSSRRGVRPLPGSRTAGRAGVRLRVLIGDDQAMVRTGFRFFLHAQPDMTVVGGVADGEEVVASARRLRPDVCLPDIRLPRPDGLATARMPAGRDVAAPLRVVVTPLPPR
ncbi:response regulator [Streptomyces sp. NPDC001680]